MFFLTDKEIEKKINTVIDEIGMTAEEISSLSDESYFKIAEKSSYLSAFFDNNISSNYPISLYYYTYRPDLEDSPLTMSIITPESFFYYVLSGRETKLFLNGLKLHRHNFYELLYVIDGEIYQNIENTRHLYPKGSFCLMNKNVRHVEEYSGYHRILFLQFSDEYISALLSFPSVFKQKASSMDNLFTFFHQIKEREIEGGKAYIDFIPKDSSNKNYEIYQAFDKIAFLLNTQDYTTSFAISHLFFTVLCNLFNKNYFETTPVQIGTEKQREIFNSISSYININLGRVTRKDLEEAFHYSGDYIYRIVEKYTGFSISAYCMHISMKNAERYLRTTDMRVQEIALLLGFSNRTQFYNEFKKAYGMTPKAYQKKFHETTDV